MEALRWHAQERLTSSLVCRVLLLFLNAHASLAIKFHGKWWALGPFASGKTEYEGDPLAPLGGVLKLFERGPAAKMPTQDRFYAEHAAGEKSCIGRALRLALWQTAWSM
eukprot:TRINITY_DN102267_c0_g1_i1.p1 TRINITY_DN102267_c0_g1~~TRINITY_DN102267_c0_g1_i1.p1  ORF type:complete len:121 (-),score=20.63 TRINITY_DN102267_c0_g1_i1:339-665(-)